MAVLSSVIIEDVIANIPAFGVAGRLFIATDENKIYYDDGTAWNPYSFSSGSVSIPYDFGAYYPTQPTASQVLNKLVFPRAASTADDFAGSYGHVDTNPTATFDVDVQVNSVSVGTVSVSTGGVFTFSTTGGALSISAGDVVEFIAPGSADATIAGLSFTITATVD